MKNVMEMTIGSGRVDPSAVFTVATGRAGAATVAARTAGIAARRGGRPATETTVVASDRGVPTGSAAPSVAATVREAPTIAIETSGQTGAGAGTSARRTPIVDPGRTAANLGPGRDGTRIDAVRNAQADDRLLVGGRGGTGTTMACDRAGSTTDPAVDPSMTGGAGPAGTVGARVSVAMAASAGEVAPTVNAARGGTGTIGRNRIGVETAIDRVAGSTAGLDLIRIVRRAAAPGRTAVSALRDTTMTVVECLVGHGGTGDGRASTRTGAIGTAVRTAGARGMTGVAGRSSAADGASGVRSTTARGAVEISEANTGTARASRARVGTASAGSEGRGATVTIMAVRTPVSSGIGTITIARTGQHGVIAAARATAAVTDSAATLRTASD